jgi:sulfur-oxidizing protein SoxX
MDFLTVLVFIFSGMYLVQAASNPELCKDAKPHEVTLFKLTKAKTLEFQIAESLDGAGGQAGRGLEIVIDPKRGNCLSCHQISSVEKLVDIDKPESKINYGYHGTIANSLDGVADKYTAGELRLIVVDPKRAFPNQDSIMPSYHRIDGFINVDPSCKGKSILSAQDVEDVVAFLLQLKSDKPAVPGN